MWQADLGGRDFSAARLRAPGRAGAPPGSERPRADSSWGLTPAGAAHVSKASSQRLQACRSRASRERGPHPRGWAIPHPGLPPALRCNSAPGSMCPVGRSPGVTRSPGLLKSRRGHELARATCSLRAALSEQGAVLGREPTCDSASPFTKGLHTHVRDPAHTPPRGTSLLRIAGDGRTAWGAEPKVRRRAAPCPRLRALCCGSSPPHRCSASQPPAGDGTPRARLGSARPSADSAGSQLLEHSTSTALPARISVFRLNANAGINLIEPLSQRPSGNRLCTSTATACSGSAAPQPASPATELLADHAGMAVRLW